MSSTPEFNAEQLASVRATRWHQSGDALLTLEAAREWVDELGLVLFAPRAHQLSMPAASLVEATLGRAAEEPSAADTEIARGLVARMVAEGTALPLNLLGAPGDLPDFIASAQVFSYVFTLRGDKAWKQPPATSGAMKVSPLATKVYDVLAERGALTAAELVSELGRELTENAIARALGELWVQLRVIPLLQQDGSATMWELTSRRLTKAIKAGANAGQPTALSALISLYLAQAYAATEDEVETFLSPLAARSRVREVLHALTAGRQLESAVLEGKTLLYIPGALPEFPEIAKPEAEETAEVPAGTAAAAPGGSRIRSFAGRGKPSGDLRGRPERRPRPERPGEAGSRPPRRMADRSEERRPRRQAEGGEQRKSFARPWEEDRRPKRTGPGERAERPGADREDRGERPRFTPENRGERPRFNRPAGERPRPEGEGGERRSFKPRKFEGDRGGAERKPFRPRKFEGDRGGATGERKPFRPRKFEGDRAGATGERKPFTPRKFEGEREARRPGGFAARGPRPERPAGRTNRPFESRSEAGERPQSRPFRPRETGDEGARKAAGRRFEGGARPGGFGARPGYTPRGAGEGGRPAAKRPFRPHTEGGAPFRPRTEGGGPPKKSFGPKRFGAGGASKPGKFAGKPGKKFGGRATGPGAKRAGAPRGTRPRGPKAEE